MDLSQPTLSCSEVEFLSEHSTVTIVPNFKEGKLFFLTVSKKLYFYTIFKILNNCLHKMSSLPFHKKLKKCGDSKRVDDCETGGNE